MLLFSLQRHQPCLFYCLKISKYFSWTLLYAFQPLRISLVHCLLHFNCKKHQPYFASCFLISYFLFLPAYFVFFVVVCILRYPSSSKTNEKCKWEMWMRNVNDNENVIDISSAYNVVPGLKNELFSIFFDFFSICLFLSRGPHYMHCLCQSHSHCHSHFSFTFLIHISHWFFSWISQVYTLLMPIIFLLFF